MTTPVLATRVRKARRESTCPACRGPIRVGQLIARCPGGLWQHASCFIGHAHQLDHDNRTEGERS
jgi:hypothetical protein